MVCYNGLTMVNNGNRMGLYPLVICCSLLLKIAIYSWFTHYKWRFSTGFSMFTRPGKCQDGTPFSGIVWTRGPKSSIGFWMFQTSFLFIFILVDHVHVGANRSMTCLHCFGLIRKDSKVIHHNFSGILRTSIFLGVALNEEIQINHHCLLGGFNI